MIKEELIYRDRPLRITGIIHCADKLSGYCGLDVVRNSLLHGYAIQYHLEPEDATRYSFILSPVQEPSGQRGLYIIRVTNHHILGTAILWDWDIGTSEFQLENAAKALRANNDHTENITLWFLAHLCRHFQ